jgi:hypothetical protein
MKTSAAIFLLGLLAVASPAMGAVQEKDVKCDSVGTATFTCTVTLATGATSGNAIVIGAAWYTPASTLSVTDDKGDNIVLLPSRLTSGGGERFQAGVLFGVTGGAQVFTFTWSGSGSTYSGAVVVEETGVNALEGYDNITSAGYTGSSNAPTSGYVGATHDNTEIAIGIGVQATYYNWTAGTGYTLLSTASSVQLAVEDRSVSNGTYQATFSTSGTNSWGATQVVLYQTSSSQFVQNVDQELVGATQTTPSVSTFPHNTTAGSLLFCSALWVNNVTVSGVTDTQGNTFHLLPRITVSGSSAFLEGFYALGTIGGADAISIAWSSGGATYIEPVCQEYSGVSAIDQHAEGAVSTSSTATSPTVTTVVGNELLIGYAATNSDTALTVGSGWTARSTTHRALLTESQFLQPIGTYNSSFGAGSAEVWATGIVSFFNGNSAPHILSANTTTCFIGQSCTFEVNASGTPAPSLSESGSLPSGITFVDNGDGTATLAGTAATGTTGNYSLVITAHNIVSPDSTQNFTLRVIPNTLVQEQDQKCNTTGTPATNCTFTLTNASPNMMFLNAAWYTNVTLAVADSQGNTWVCLPRRASPGTSFYVNACFALSIKSGSNTVTLTWSGTGSTFSGAALGEWSGVNAFEDYDYQTNTGNYYGGTSEATNSNSRTSAKHDSLELAIGYAASASFTSWAAGTGWTLRSTAADVQLGLEDQIVSNGTYTEDFPLGTANEWVAGIAIFFQTDTAQFVQGSDHDDGIAAPAPSDTYAYNVNVVSGQFLIDLYVWVNTPTISQTSKTDSLGNSWTCEAALLMSDGATSSQLCHSFATHSGADTVTATFSGSGASYIGMAHAAFTGVNAIDQDSQQTGTSTAPQSQSATTGQANELLIGWFATAAGFSPWTTTGAWTARATSYRSIGLESQYLQPTGNYNAAFTSVDAVWASGIITLYESSGSSRTLHRVNQN